MFDLFYQKSSLFYVTFLFLFVRKLVGFLGLLEFLEHLVVLVLLFVELFLLEGDLLLVDFQLLLECFLLNFQFSLQRRRRNLHILQFLCQLFILQFCIFNMLLLLIKHHLNTGLIRFCLHDFIFFLFNIILKIFDRQHKLTFFPLKISTFLLIFL